MVGRPRGIDDAAILDATVRVMGRTGPAALTLALVAEEAGVVPGTLVQRFKSKRGLILALAEHNARRSSELCRQAQRDRKPPLEALVDLVVGIWEPATTPEAFANHLAFLCADLADAQLRDLTLATHRSQSRLIGELLTSGVNGGDLASDTDIETLTATIQSAIAGAGLIWAIEQQDSLTERLHSGLERVLAPHRNHAH